LNAVNEIFKTVKARQWFISPLEKECLSEEWSIPFSDRPINGLDFTIACRQLCREYRFESELILCMLKNRTLHLILHCGGYFLDSLKPAPHVDLDYVVIATSGLKPANGWTIHARLV